MPKYRVVAVRKRDETRLVVLDDASRDEAEFYVLQSNFKEGWRVVIEEMPVRPASRAEEAEVTRPSPWAAEWREKTYVR